MAAFTSQLGTPNSMPGYFFLGAEDAPYAPVIPSVATGKILPIIARVFQSDGITYVTSFGNVDLPPLKYTANGSGQPITLLVQNQVGVSAPPPIYGAPTYGSVLYGGGPVGLGNLVRISEQGGDNTILYTGIVESLPTQYDVDTQVAIELNPIGAEAGYTDYNFNYTAPVDIAQMVRDAVAATSHLWCTPQSVPNTGILDVYQFNKTHVSDVFDTCRTRCGPNYFWFVDPSGCVWFQPQGSAAGYTVKQGQSFTARKSKQSITELRNSFVVVGGPIPGGSSYFTSPYSNSTSIQNYGKRTLQPSPTYPEAVSQATLDAIKTTLGTILDRPIQKTMIRVDNFPRRIWLGQPGGAVLSYWEPATEPQPQAIVGSGTYSSPLFVRDVEILGSTQVAILDQYPSSIDDLDAMMHRQAARDAVLPLIYTPQNLQVVQTLNGGGVQSGPSGGRFVLDGINFRVYDPTGQKRAEMGNLAALGISPAQWGFRAIDQNNNPFFDSLGLIAVMQQLGQLHGGFANQTITSGPSSPTLLNDTSVSASITFNLSRPVRVAMFADVQAKPALSNAYVDVFLDGNDITFPNAQNVQQASVMLWDPANTGFTSCFSFFSGSLAGGSHTLQLKGYTTGGGGSNLVVTSWDMWVFQLGA